jgi:hypothetical protein
MSDDPIKISPEQLSGIRLALKEYEGEFRRSIETSTGFFEKLFALDAALMGVAATVVMAIMARSEYPTCPLREAVRGLVVIFNLLGFSLVFAVIHHFLAVHIAANDAAYADVDLTGAGMRDTFQIALANTPGVGEVATAQAEVVKGMMHQKLVTEPQKKIVTAKQRKHHCMKISGNISIGAFLLAYIFLVYCSCLIW